MTAEQPDNWALPPNRTIHDMDNVFWQDMHRMRCANDMQALSRMWDLYLHWKKNIE